jgi:hypothetical protein
MNPIPPPSRQDIIQMLVTEHFTLQSARSATISDANGRTSFFLSTLSGLVVALAFVAQMSAFGQAFVFFALILLPTILFIGLASFERLLQLGVENIRCVVAINRIRHYYLEVAPELRPHFTLSPHDDARGVLVSLGAIREGVRPWDPFVTNAGMVAMVDAVLAGVIAAIAALQLGVDVGGAVAAGGIVGVVLLAGLISYLVHTWRTAARVIGVRFPSEGGVVDLSHIAPLEPHDPRTGLPGTAGEGARPEASAPER